MINITTYIFIFIFLVYHCILFYKTLDVWNTNKNNGNFILLLDKYYISNIKYDLFVLSFYFFFSVLLFIAYRISFFKKETYVEVFDGITLNYSVIFNFIFFLLSMIYYIKILDLLFQDYLIKIHFYLMQYSWYTKVHEFEIEHYQWVSSILGNLASFFYLKICLEEDLISLFYSSQKNKTVNVYKSKQYLSWQKVQKSAYLWSFYRVLLPIIKMLKRWTSLFLYYALHSTVFLVLLYDIEHGKLYYIYYMLCIYFLIKFLRKVRHFLQVKDPVYDDLIMQYFYKNQIPYEKMRQSIMNNDKDQTIYASIRYHETAIRKYFKDDFQVYYMVDPHMTKNRKRNHNFAKRFNVIFLLILGAIYNSIYHKYFIFISSHKSSLNFILIPTIVILFYSNYKIFYHPATKEKALEYKPYLWLFRIIFCIVVLPLLYIILKNKITVMPQEVLFSLNSFRVVEVFSIEAYFDYLSRYVRFLQRIIPLESDLADDIIIQAKKVIKDNVSCENIRNIVKDLLVSKEINTMPLQNIWEKIKSILKL